MAPIRQTGRYTLLSHGHVHDHSWSVHAPGCPDIPADAAAHDSVIEKHVDLDLADDKTLMLAIDTDQLGYTADAVHIHDCARAVAPGPATDMRGEVS